MSMDVPEGSAMSSYEYEGGTMIASRHRFAKVSAYTCSVAQANHYLHRASCCSASCVLAVWVHSILPWHS